MPVTEVYYSEGMLVPAKFWIPIQMVEQKAIQQIENVAKIPEIVGHIAVMPDTHVGYGCPIGTISMFGRYIPPAMVGTDIGCGMIAVQLRRSEQEIRDHLDVIHRSIKRSIPTGFNSHKQPCCEQANKYIEQNGTMLDGTYDTTIKCQLGTLGGGNHFIEICTTVDHKEMWLILHSGSRHIGSAVATHYLKLAQEQMLAFYADGHPKLIDTDLAYLDNQSDLGKEYIRDMTWCMNYAKLNRQIMAIMILKDIYWALGIKYYTTEEMMSFQSEEILKDENWVQCHHNYMEVLASGVTISRKGAVSAQLGEKLIIPGSMGTPTYLAKGLGESASHCSSAHGAGRIMSRKKAKHTFSVDDVKKQTEGVLCDISQSVVNEAPKAYKDIDMVMEMQKDLVIPYRKLKQIMCIKGD